jgi:hypothetical protein
MKISSIMGEADGTPTKRAFARDSMLARECDHRDLCTFSSKVQMSTNKNVSTDNVDFDRKYNMLQGTFERFNRSARKRFLFCG